MVPHTRPLITTDKIRIGLELHLMLQTRTKLFCSCTNFDPQTDAPKNAHTCPICLGYPGTKPWLNQEAVKQGLQLARLFEMTLPTELHFDRKTYFYPDLPKGFQITQFHDPLGRDGQYEFEGELVRIRELHLEEDPASIELEADRTVTILNYNRSGCPLIELVTEPVFRSPKQARAFLRQLILDIESILGYEPIGWRADCNISHSEGTRTELKNINGFQNVERAFEAEIHLWQTEGLPTIASTKHFDAEQRTVSISRIKEKEGEYLYLPEPNLQRIEITAELLEQSKINIGRSFSERSRRLLERDSELDPVFVRQLCLGGLDQIYLRLRETVCRDPVVAIFGLLRRYPLEHLNKHLITIELFLKQQENREISSVEAQTQIRAILRSEKQIGLQTGSIEELIEELIRENPSLVTDLRTKPRTRNFLIGSIIRKTGGSVPLDQIDRAIARLLEEVK